MKTLEETYDWVASISGFQDTESMFKDITGDTDLIEFYMRLVATKYAEEAINECADKAVIFLPHSHYHGTRNIDKDSILKVKEELK